MTAEYLPHLKAWLEDAGAAKVACDVKSALLALGRLGIEARGFEHDVMLYAFLLDADPSGCSLEEQARRRLDLQLGPAPEQHADITLELWKQLAPAVEARGMGKLYAEIELPLARGAGAHGTGRRAHRHRRAAAALGADGRPDRAADGPDPRAWPAGRSTSARRSSLARCCSTSCICRRR